MRLSQTSLEASLGPWVVRRRWLVIVLTIAMVLTGACGVRWLTFNNDLRAFFGEQDPHLRALTTLESTYGRDNNVVFVVAPRSGDIFTQHTLAALEELTAAAWQMPYSYRVESITNFSHIRVRGDEIVIEDLVDGACRLSDAEVEYIRGIALSEGMLLHRLVSCSGRITAVSVNVHKPGRSLDEVPRIASFARGLVNRLQQEYPSLDVYLTGTVMFDHSFGQASRDDAMTLVPIMFVALLCIVILVFRSMAATFATFVVIIASMLTGMGLAGWLGVPLDPASAGAGIVIFTLAVADSVHILATLFKELGQGTAKQEAVVTSLRINLRAVFLTSATTAVGFLGMNFSEAPPFRYLGNIVAMGVAAAFLYSVFLLPALLAVLPVRRRRMDDRTAFSRRNWPANIVIQQRRSVFWGTLIAGAILGIGVFRIELEDDFVRYFSKRYEIRQATDFVQQNLTGAYAIEYSLASGEPEGISAPDYLTLVERFGRWFGKQPKVAHVYSIADTVKYINEKIHEDDEQYSEIPNDRALIAQYLLLYELALPLGMDLNHRISLDRSATRMTVVLNDMATGELLELDEKAQRWLETNAPETMFTQGTGVSMIWAHLTRRNIRSMLGASFAVLTAISFMLVFAIRSLFLGLLSLIPNLMPILMALGIWGLTVGRIGLAASVILSLTIGIVVDDTIHFLCTYRRARRVYRMNSSDAVRFCFRTVGSAIWVTSVVLVVGFSAFCFSGYRVSVEMGLLTAITVAFALVMDFLLLPTLLLKIDDGHVGACSHPKTN
jgi:hypothetical protein